MSGAETDQSKIDEEVKLTRRVEKDGDIVRVTFIHEELDEMKHIRSVELILEEMEKIFESNQGQQFYGLADLTPLANKISYLSKNIRDQYAKIIDHPRINKVAIFGANKFFEVATNFILESVGNKDKARMFATEEEAVSWLRQ